MAGARVRLFLAWFVMTLIYVTAHYWVESMRLQGPTVASHGHARVGLFTTGAAASLAALFVAVMVRTRLTHAERTDDALGTASVKWVMLLWLWAAVFAVVALVSLLVRLLIGHPAWMPMGPFCLLLPSIFVGFASAVGAASR